MNTVWRLMYVTYVKHVPNVRLDFEHVQVAMDNSYANENAEMGFSPKFEINVEFAQFVYSGWTSFEYS